MEIIVLAATFFLGLWTGAKLEGRYWVNRRRRQRKLEQEANLRQMDTERFEMTEPVSQIKKAA